MTSERFFDFFTWGVWIARVGRSFLDGPSTSCRHPSSRGLSVDGVCDGVAIVPYYAPGLLADALRNMPNILDTVKLAVEIIIGNQECGA